MAAPKKSTAIAVPRAKLALPADVEADMAKEMESFKKRLAAPSGTRIGTDEKLFTLPNGDTNDTLNVIIVDFVSYNAYFDRPWVKGGHNIPACFAIGMEISEMAPSENSPEVQHESCAACWANQWESGVGKAKACSNTKLLAVIAPDGNEESQIMLLKVTSTALKNFDAYVTSVARGFQRPPRGVITEITFDQNAKHSSLRFGNPQACSKEQMALAYHHREAAMERLMTEPDVSKFMAAAPKAGKKAPVRKAA